MSGINGISILAVSRKPSSEEIETRCSRNCIAHREGRCPGDPHDCGLCGDEPPLSPMDTIQEFMEGGFHIEQVF